MPARIALEVPQASYLMTLGGIEAGPASPIAAVAAATPCAPDSADAATLAQRGLVLTKAEPRLNAAFRGVLQAVARPEEVLTLRASGAGQPAIVLCRRGEFWAQCDVGAQRMVLTFPLSRTAMIVAAAAALSSGHDEPPPSDFHFRGRAADLLVLHTLLAAGDGGIDAGVLPERVRAYLSAHAGNAFVAALADPRGLDALFTDDSGSARAASRLHDAGLVPARAARAVLRASTTAGFSASRTAIRESGASTVAMQVWRMGDHNLVVRPVRLDDGTPGLDARDMQRADIRALVAAVYQDEGTLAEVVGAP